jgi:hypothetical protein
MASPHKAIDASTAIPTFMSAAPPPTPRRDHDSRCRVKKSIISGDNGALARHIVSNAANWCQSRQYFSSFLNEL